MSCRFCSHFILVSDSTVRLFLSCPHEAGQHTLLYVFVQVNADCGFMKGDAIAESFSLLSTLPNMHTLTVCASSFSPFDFSACRLSPASAPSTCTVSTYLTATKLLSLSLWQTW